MERDHRISQKFFKNSRYVYSLLDKTDLNAQDIVVEIGPGKGIITEQLAKRVKKVIAIEYDKKLIKNLQQRFSDYPNVEIIEGDFLQWDLPKYPYRVFSNIPFNMTADIVSKLLETSDAPEATYLIMQDKAAERFIGEPIGNNSQISILLKAFYDISILTEISRNQFEPRPNVDTVLTKFIKRRYSLIKHCTVQEYRDFVIYGYNQWKPTILEAFEEVFSYKQTKILKKNLNIEGKKPTQLGIDSWIKLFETYIKYVPDFKKDKVRGAERNLAQKQRNMNKEHRTRARQK